MKASLIISVYKNIPFLKTVLDSLKFQTEKRFEIIIAEDGEDRSMREFIAQYPFEQPYQHICQEDRGWQKNRSLNNAIRAAQTAWLIFIDGIVFFMKDSWKCIYALQMRELCWRENV